jgi:hypothetical protein
MDNAIQSCHGIWIIENQDCCLKIDSVLPQIAPILSVVPIKLHVVTIL